MSGVERAVVGVEALGVERSIKGVEQSGAEGGAVITLSSSTVADNASIGTTIGTLAVIGGTGSYTFTLVSNPGSLFSITGNALKVAAALTAGSDPISIKADNGAGSVITQPFLITVTSSAGSKLQADFSTPSDEPWVFW